MTWYAAHLILYTKFLDGVQDSYPVWENVLLIYAADPDAAYTIADKNGQEQAAASDGYTYDGRPAAWVYAGVRRLNEMLEQFDTLQAMQEMAQELGTELTHSSFVLPNEAALGRLLANQDVTLIYEGYNSDVD